MYHQKKNGCDGMSPIARNFSEKHSYTWFSSGGIFLNHFLFFPSHHCLSKVKNSFVFIPHGYCGKNELRSFQLFL